MGVLRPRHSRPGCHEDEPLGYVCSIPSPKVRKRPIVGVTHIARQPCKIGVMKSCVVSFEIGREGVSFEIMCRRALPVA